jgi:hypothetical protein
MRMEAKKSVIYGALRGGVVATSLPINRGTQSQLGPDCFGYFAITLPELYDTMCSNR